MSHNLVATLLRAYRGPRAALPVLLVLADHASAQGVAWPCVRTIADRCQISERQVRSHLSKLAAGGWLRPINSRKGGRAMSTRWQIVANPEMDFRVSDEIPGSAVPPSRPETRKPASINPEVGRQKPGSQVPPKQLRINQEPLSEVPPKRERRSAAPPQVTDPAFEDFWAAYPKKKAKSDASKAWQKLHPDAALAEHIVMQVKRASKTHDWLKDGGQFIPYPATYLNGRRFEDELVAAPKVTSLTVAL